MVVPQQPAQPFAAPNVEQGGSQARSTRCRAPDGSARRGSAPQTGRALGLGAASEQDEAVETLLPDRARKALRVGIGTRRLDGRPYDPHPAPSTIRRSLRTRFSATRHSMTCCWWRLTHPARVTSSTCKGKGSSFIGRSYPDWKMGKSPNEFSDTTGATPSRISSTPPTATWPTR